MQVHRVTLRCHKAGWPHDILLMQGGGGIEYMSRILLCKDRVATVIAIVLIMVLVAGVCAGIAIAVQNARSRRSTGNVSLGRTGIGNPGVSHAGALRDAGWMQARSTSPQHRPRRLLCRLSRWGRQYRELGQLRRRRRQCYQLQLPRMPATGQKTQVRERLPAWDPDVALTVILQVPSHAVSNASFA